MPDIDVEETADEEVEEAEHLEFYHMIEQCKSLLQDNKVRDAKIIYKQLRDKFNASKIEASAKSTLYNSIRELYDDINLASMEQE